MSELRDHARRYLLARDAAEKRLKGMEDVGDTIVCHYKDRDVTVLPMERLSAAAGSEAGNVLVITLQNEQNFEALLASFATFSKNPNLTILFLNPQLGEKWLLKPAVHAAVADKANLRQGLLTMYQTVPPV